MINLCVGWGWEINRNLWNIKQWIHTFKITNKLLMVLIFIFTTVFAFHLMESCKFWEQRKGVLYIKNDNNSRYLFTWFDMRYFCLSLCNYSSFTILSNWWNLTFWAELLNLQDHLFPPSRPARSSMPRGSTLGSVHFSFYIIIFQSWFFYADNTAIVTTSNFIKLLISCCRIKL